ncbi:MAG: TetR/AcrR family transcriptional regulator [Solirubrobacterales bacterium]|nr:TetR/AcrR family transcriptional regulator [Solirubrobacterales bacterium]
MDAEREKLFGDVAGALTANHSASTAEIAAVAGVSRATLHRIFGTREALVEAIYGWLLERCDERFDAAGVDPVGDQPPSGELDSVLEIFDRLIDDSYPIAQSLWLLIATPSLEQNRELLDRLEDQDLRLERLFLRGQREGLFRTDLPSRWLGYSLGAQVMSAWYLVEDGYAGTRDVPRLVRSAILDGVLAESARRGPR